MEMRKLWLRRRAIESVIGGLIVLALLLMSLVAMVVLTRQYDAYQGVAAQKQVEDTDRYSENLQVVYPGLSLLEPFEVPCVGGLCNAYNMTLLNLGIGTRILRIYISSIQRPGCTNTCIINPNPSATPAPFTFQASKAYINQGESVHSIIFWLPWDLTSKNYTLPKECKIGGVKVNYDCNSITVVTFRGRQFSFQWQLSPTATAAYAARGGGTGIYIGPLVYTFQTGLFTYTTPTKLTPPVPTVVGTQGYWMLPTNTPLIIYIKLQTDVNVTHDVYLTQQSLLELAQFTSPGNPVHFYVVAPITVKLCSTIASLDPAQDIVCDPSYGYDATNSIGNNGNPNNLVDYLPCAATPLSSYNTATCLSKGLGARYRIPAPQVPNVRGPPVIVAFAENCLVDANDKCTGGKGANQISNSWSGGSATSYLGLTYVWDDASGTGSYVYGVTLPFVALCLDTCKG
jgi:hypothetical protein